MFSMLYACFSRSLPDSIVFESQWQHISDLNQVAIGHRLSRGKVSSVRDIHMNITFNSASLQTRACISARIKSLHVRMGADQHDTSDSKSRHSGHMKISRPFRQKCGTGRLVWEGLHCLGLYSRSVAPGSCYGWFGNQLGREFI